MNDLRERVLGQLRQVVIGQDDVAELMLSLVRETAEARNDEAKLLGVIARFAFEYARSEGRTKVACATKANILKFSEGEMKRAFEKVAPDYPEIEPWHVIVDNAAHQLIQVSTPNSPLPSDVVPDPNGPTRVRTRKALPISSATSAAMTRTRNVLRLRAATRSSRSTMGRKVTTSSYHFFGRIWRVKLPLRSTGMKIC